MHGTNGKINAKAALVVDIRAARDFNRGFERIPESLGEINLNMEKDETIAAHEKRRQTVYADDDDILVRVLDIPEADYECVMVNSSWLERGLLEGDIILFAARDNPEEGDIVLIEEDQHTRLGVASVPGYLETSQGRRPLEWSERIVGVGVALARKLGLKRDA